LTPYLQRTPKELSGGSASASASRRPLAQVFLFDEPLSISTPPRAADAVEIAKLHRELNGTTIYVTHDQVEATTPRTASSLRDGQSSRWAPAGLVLPLNTSSSHSSSGRHR
jgi:multiple sugar transport system ATP-binding protein